MHIAEKNENGAIMKTGISTGCLYPMLTEAALEKLLSLGYDTIEIFFNSFSELETDYLDRIRYLLDKNDARAVSLHPFTSSFESFLLFSSYERRFLDGVSFYEMYFRAAQRLGTDKIILHGLNTDYASSLTDSEYFRRFEILQERARKYGTELLQENVCRFRSRDPDFIEKMAREIPESAAFVCDVKQAARRGLDPKEMAHAMGDKLRHVHISDIGKNGDCVLPGKGQYDTEGFLKELINSGYNGSIMIEVYRFSFDKIEELKEAHDYLDKLINRITA